MKPAETACSPFMVTVQACVPEHAPPQPVKIEPEAGVAIRVTMVPPARPAEQVAPQLIEPLLLDTVPEPDPSLVTTSCGLTPVPDRLTVCTGLTASSKVSVPLRGPRAAGANVTVALHEAPASRELPQLLLWL